MDDIKAKFAEARAKVAGSFPALGQRMDRIRMGEVNIALEEMQKAFDVAWSHMEILWHIESDPEDPGQSGKMVAEHRRRRRLSETSGNADPAPAVKAAEAEVIADIKEVPKPKKPRTKRSKLED